MEPSKLRMHWQTSLPVSTIQGFQAILCMHIVLTHSFLSKVSLYTTISNLQFAAAEVLRDLRSPMPSMFGWNKRTHVGGSSHNALIWSLFIKIVNQMKEIEVINLFFV